MRLINTTTLRLSQDFLGSRIPEKYAILSHRWGQNEPNLQQYVSEIASLYEMEGYKKIVAAATIARERGYEWIWIDTVCIDKTSSAELSESINSMFKWYRDAEFCFAYLNDVTDIGDMEGSEWFKRGWTLQELLAPQRLLFFDKDWQPLETKWFLADSLSNITKIAKEVLRQQVELGSISVAVRMSWASNRKTTREEDIAYCLLGIFDVNMPLLYGEGKHSFFRLQQAILQEIGDTSLLAWDPVKDGATGAAHKPRYTPALASSPIGFRNCGKLERRREYEGRFSCLVNRRSVQVPVLLKSRTYSHDDHAEVALPCGVAGGDVDIRKIIRLVLVQYNTSEVYVRLNEKSFEAAIRIHIERSLITQLAYYGFSFDMTEISILQEYVGIPEQIHKGIVSRLDTLLYLAIFTMGVLISVAYVATRFHAGYWTAIVISSICLFLAYQLSPKDRWGRHRYVMMSVIRAAFIVCWAVTTWLGIFRLVDGKLVDVWLIIDPSQVAE